MILNLVSCPRIELNHNTVAEEARMEESHQLRDPEESLLLRNNELEAFYYYLRR